MKSLVFNILLNFSLILLTYCSTRKDKINTHTLHDEKEFIVYGTKNCPHCMKFIHSLDSAEIKYNFRDVEIDQVLFNELYQKIQKANFKGYVTYPVIEIDGKILVNPGINEFFGLLRSQNSMIH